MGKYSIKLPNIDFKFLNYTPNTKGSRLKRLVIDINDNRKAWFKYQGKGYNVSEACSEKMSFEIAKILGYNCAKIELAKDENNQLGILNYLFVDLDKTTHMDAISYLNKQEKDRPYFYTISNIKKTLDNIDKNLLPLIADTNEKLIYLVNYFGIMDSKIRKYIKTQNHRHSKQFSSYFWKYYFLLYPNHHFCQ